MYRDAALIIIVMHPTGGAHNCNTRSVLLYLPPAMRIVPRPLNIISITLHVIHLCRPAELERLVRLFFKTT